MDVSRADEWPVDERPAAERSATRAVEATWRVEAPRLVAGLSRITRDVGLAEDLAQDALVAALEQWPVGGIPDNPGAWLATTARRRGIDHIRRDANLRRKYAEVAVLLERAESAESGADAAVLDTEEISDDLLRLVFTACHPVLAQEAQVALTLRMLGGLTTTEIARAFLLPEQTIAQRIVRAKRRLSRDDVAFEVPEAAELPDRVSAVLSVVYLVFNEGYSATVGSDWMRPALCEEAMRLGRVLAGLLPGDAEVHGLVALMELQHSRAGARVDRSGRPVLLADQDRTRWDRLLIERGLAALGRAEELGELSGTYALQAAIAACHALAARAEDTDWPRIVELYDALLVETRSPVVALNRVVAIGMAFGPEAGLVALAEIAEVPALRDYPYLSAVWGDLLDRVGRSAEAREKFAEAAAATTNERERAELLGRADAASPPPPPGC